MDGIVRGYSNFRPEFKKLFSYSTQLSTKFILLINVKMPTIVGILTYISIMKKTSKMLKARNFFICTYVSFYEQLKFRAQLSWEWRACCITSELDFQHWLQVLIKTYNHYKEFNLWYVLPFTPPPNLPKTWNQTFSEKCYTEAMQACIIQL